MSRSGAVLIGLGGIIAACSISAVIFGFVHSSSEIPSPPARLTHPVAQSNSAPLQQVQDRPDDRDHDNDLNRALRAAEQTNLDPHVERALLTLAEEALRADVTGVGRERFRSYLPGQPPLQVYRDMRIQAGVVHRVDDTTVEAQLLWTATSPTGEHVERRTATVLLKYTGRSWMPQQR